MPTTKPRIQTLVTNDMYVKFKELCKLENRSESNLANKIITEYIQNYEKQNGSIVIGEINQSGSGNSINIG